MRLTAVDDSGHALACVRAALAVVIALRVGTGPFRALAGQPRELFVPPWFLEWLAGMPSTAVLVGLQALGVAAAVACVAGRSPRATFATSWLCLLVLAGLRGSLGKVLHNDVLLVLACVPVLAAPAGARIGDRDTRRPSFAVPIRGALAVAATVYLLAAVQKLRHSGVEWVFSDNYRWVLYGGAASGRAPTAVVARFFADRAWLAVAGAAATLLFELAAPLFLAVRRLRPWFLGLAVAFHGATWLTLGLDYWGWILTVAALTIPWERVRLSGLAWPGRADPRPPSVPAPG